MVQDGKIQFLSNSYTAQNGWNKKLCFEARDTLFSCADAQENGNKFRCPDELYAYEMWCPNDFRRLQSVRKRRSDLENEIYDKSMVDKINSERASISKGKWVQS